MRARHLQLLAGLTLAGALLRFTTLGVQSYWLDEVATVNILHKGFGTMFLAIASGESTPPLYYVVAWLWAKLFGTGEVGLRALSALLGTLTIPVAFALGRRAVGDRAGLIAAALTAFNPLLFWYSQEARSYALMVLLTGLGLLVFLDLLRAPSGRRYALWALLGIASLATHYYSGFLLGAECLWLLWRAPRRDHALAAIAAIVVAAGALLPLALHQKSTGAAGFISASPILRRLAQIPKQFAVGYHGPAEVAFTVVTLLLAAYGVLRLIVHVRASMTTSNQASLHGERALVLGVIGVASIVAAFVLSIVGPDYLISRNVIAAWLPLGVAVAAGLAVARGGVAAAAAICAVGLVVIIGVDSNEQYQRDDWRGAAHYIGASSEPRAIIVTPAAGTTPLLYYLPHARKTPPTGENVKDVVFVGLASRTPGQAPAPPRPSLVAFANFNETRRQQAQTYTVVEEQSAVGAVIPPQIGASPLDGEPALTLYQP